MSTLAKRAQSAARPLGGTSGDWRARLVRFHLPIGLGSVALVVLFMTLPVFDPLGYVRMDMESRNPVPQPMDMSSPHPMRQDEGQVTGHGQTGQAPADAHASQPTAGPPAHGQQPAASPQHGATQTSAPSGHEGAPAGMGMSGDSRAQSRFDQRLTVATGYVATLLLALTLLVGPANLILRRRNPVSSYLRRDVGMWTAGFSVLHVIVGLQVHSNGQLSGFLSYFVGRDGGPLVNSFGLANWTGLAATVIVVGLLTISSDLALRTLKAGTWKWLQRLNYGLFLLVVMHAIFYGALLRVTSPFTLLLGIGVGAVLIGQLIGVWLWRQRRSGATTAAA